MQPKSAAEIKCEQLTNQLATSNEENARLKAKVEELEIRLQSFEKGGNVKSKLSDALMTDSLVNPDRGDEVAEDPADPPLTSSSQ